jgi:hypothetical protein
MVAAPNVLLLTMDVMLLRQLAQIPKTVDTRLVLIAPAKIQCVAADDIQVSYGQFLRDRFWLQNALSSPLVDALRARASTSQLRRRVAGDAIISPGYSQASVPFLLDLSGFNSRPAPLSCFHDSSLHD